MSYGNEKKMLPFYCGNGNAMTKHMASVNLFAKKVIPRFFSGIISLYIVIVNCIYWNPVLFWFFVVW